VTTTSSVFDSVDFDQLRRRTSEKWTAYPPDVLPAHIAEMDFALAPPIARVLREAIDAGDVGYAAASHSELAETFAGFAERRWSWDVDPARVVAVPDVMVGVAELLRVLTRPGDGVVINTPVYPPFFSVIAETERTAVEVPLLEGDERLRLPLDGIHRALADGADAVLLCNPHNPTGYVAAEEELLALAGIVLEHDAILLSDEIHGPLVQPGKRHLPFCSLPADACETAITLTSASKGWNIAGLKCGLAIAASERMRDALAALPVDLHDRVGHLGVRATVAALAEGEPWLDELREYLAGTHAFVQRLLAEYLPDVVCQPAQATFLAWLDCRTLGLGDDPAEHFLTHGRVALHPGPLFGPPGRGFVRLNVGTSRALVEEAVRRMASALG
jgi:cysteine-S-conjugate beta-lyase